jgi:hypothetical protein
VARLPQNREQLADLVRAREIDGVEHEHRLHGLLGRLLRIETEILPKRFFGLRLAGQGEVASRAPEPEAPEGD